MAIADNFQLHPLRKTDFSFVPKYHKQTERDGVPIWVPMFNPIRECVQTEARRIREEAGLVDSSAWVRPAVTRVSFGEVWKATWGITKFFVGSLLVGAFMANMPFIGPGFNALQKELQPVVLFVMGAGTWSLFSLVLALRLMRKAGQN